MQVTTSTWGDEKVPEALPWLNARGYVQEHDGAQGDVCRWQFFEILLLVLIVCSEIRSAEADWAGSRSFKGLEGAAFDDCTWNVGKSGVGILFKDTEDGKGLQVVSVVEGGPAYLRSRLPPFFNCLAIT
jgi:hypothetical protein